MDPQRVFQPMKPECEREGETKIDNDNMYGRYLSSNV